MKFTKITDNLLSLPYHKEVDEYVRGPGWTYGWQSNVGKQTFKFWHKHYAGQVSLKNEEPYNCATELSKTSPLLSEFWNFLANDMLKGHTLVRCYANGHHYGNDGALHTDAFERNNYTTIYYPHEKWEPDWAGETVFFSAFEPDRAEIIGAVYPKPNRLLTFPGNIPHVARGVSRSCPVLRITLMFKTIA